MVKELRVTMTLQKIADEVGMSKGAVHDLGTGRGKTVVYETGILLNGLYKRVKRARNRRKT